MLEVGAIEEMEGEAKGRATDALSNNDRRRLTRTTDVRVSDWRPDTRARRLCLGETVDFDDAWSVLICTEEESCKRCRWDDWWWLHGEIAWRWDVTRVPVQ